MEKKTILIVDDEAGFTRMLKIFLEATGNYHVECETDSTAAVARAREVRPDGILIDLIMPRKDGAEVKAEMDADPFLSSIPKIFFTSNVNQSDLLENGLVKTGDGLMLPKTTAPKLVRECIDALVAGTLTP